MTTKSVPARRRKTKPAKPRKDFPLFAHASGQWAKKVRGKMHYFGTWDDPIAAEGKWDREKQALLEGRDPDVATHGDSIGWLCNAFMESKALQRERGELSQRAFNDYHRVCKDIAAFFGKSRSLESLRSNDFERYRNQLPATWGPTTVNNHLRLARVLFKFSNDIEATERGIRYQIGLKSVPKSVVRKHDATKPAKEFTAAEVHALLDGAGVPMKAFILLGINCAYGPMDIARLKKADIDFKGQWLCPTILVRSPASLTMRTFTPKWWSALTADGSLRSVHGSADRPHSWEWRSARGDVQKEQDSGLPNRSSVTSRSIPPRSNESLSRPRKHFSQKPA